MIDTRDGVIGECFLDIFHAHDGLFADREIGDSKALPFQELAALQYSRMLDAGSHDMSSPVGKQTSYTVDGRVVSLGAATGEDDFAVLRREQPGHLGTSTIDSSPGFLSIGVNGGRIAEGREEIRLHRLQYNRVQGSGCIVVEVDLSLHLRSVFTRILTRIMQKP